MLELKIDGKVKIKDLDDGTVVVSDKALSKELNETLDTNGNILTFIEE